MEDGFAFSLDRIGDRGFPAFPAQHAGIAGLAAGARVKHGAVQHDALGRADQYRAGCLPQVWPIQKQAFRHVRMSFTARAIGFAVGPGARQATIAQWP